MSLRFEAVGKLLSLITIYDDTTYAADDERTISEMEMEMEVTRLAILHMIEARSPAYTHYDYF